MSCNIHDQIFNEMLLKLGISQNHHLISKSQETLELIKVKSNELLKHLNDNAEIILCLDICCDLLNIPFCEISLATQYSCLKKSQYKQNKKILQKVLDLNKKMTISEVIRKLGLTSSSSLEKTAKEIFKLYMNQHAYENQEIGASVFVMSVYIASKLENIKISKKNALSLSDLTPRQWSNMEKSWNILSNTYSKIKCEKVINQESSKENIQEITKNHQDLSLDQKECLGNEETYDAWAKRILAQAYSELRTSK